MSAVLYLLNAAAAVDEKGISFPLLCGGRNSASEPVTQEIITPDLVYVHSSAERGCLVRRSVSLLCCTFVKQMSRILPSPQGTTTL